MIAPRELTPEETAELRDLLRAQLAIASDDDEEPACRVATLEDIRARMENGPVVIHHWATWCESCVEEMPVLRRLVGRASIPIVGLSWDAFEGEEPGACLADVKAVAGEHRLSVENWVVDSDPDAFFDALSMDFKQVPQTWVVNGAGEIVQRPKIQCQEPVVRRPVEKITEIPKPQIFEHNIEVQTVQCVEEVVDAPGRRIAAGPVDPEGCAAGLFGLEGGEP